MLFGDFGAKDTVKLTTENDSLHKLVMMLKEVNFITSKFSQKHNL
jgi:hypothetical protein